jgi:tripartite-type tricarboxylate transporter receptor subunit TctC
MNGVNRSLAFWLVALVLGYGGACAAQERPGGYPARPIRLIVAASPGAGGDMIARLVAQMLSKFPTGRPRRAADVASALAPYAR